VNRPGQLTTICLIAIILSSAGILTSLSTLGGMVLPKAQMFPNNLPEKDNKFVEAQKQMMKAMQVVSRQYRTYQVVILIAFSLISIAILIPAILTMQMRESAAKILSVAFWSAVPIEIGRSILNGVVSHKMSGVMLQYMHQMLQTGPSPDKQLQNVDGIMSNFLHVFSGVAVVFGIVWTAAKIGFYVYSAMYLRKPQMQQAFLSQSATPPPLPR